MLNSQWLAALFAMGAWLLSGGSLVVADQQLDEQGEVESAFEIMHGMATQRPAGHPEIIHGVAGNWLGGAELVSVQVLSGRGTEAESDVESKAAGQTRSDQRARTGPRRASPPWAYTPPDSLRYRPRHSWNKPYRPTYKPIRHANYRPKQSFQYTPKRSYRYDPSGTARRANKRAPRIVERYVERGYSVSQISQYLWIDSARVEALAPNE